MLDSKAQGNTLTRYLTKTLHPLVLRRVTRYLEFISLRKKCPNTEFFLVRIQSVYKKIRTKKISVFGHF